ncbi:DUF6318 family protein [Nocardioides allogilvus]|uniref:DUF6318 family protein n=1 Tax=Nocardioides allogilvus TaxID=2072017 RepID=UPI000D2FD5C6|nr:DUF6318 family protein [Nocardioides allogilvus]
MLVRRLLAATVVVPLLLVAGCSDEEPEPVMPTTSSPTTSPSSTPTVDPLAIPAEAKEPTKAGAEALIRHFWDMVAHLRETGDPRPARLAYSDSCTYCDGGVQYFLATLKQGHTFTGKSDSVASVKADIVGDSGTIAYAEVVTRSYPHDELDDSGNLVNRFPGAKVTMGYFLAFENQAWTITNVGEPE